MIPVPSGMRVWLAVGHTDMRRGMNSLAIQVQQGLKRDLHVGGLRIAIDSVTVRRRQVTRVYQGAEERLCGCLDRELRLRE